MTYGIYLHGTPIGIATEHDGRWLKEYDPTIGKHGHIISTPFPLEAKQFASREDAMIEWQRAHGVRDMDGRPNRPLTAWTVSIELLPVDA